MMWNSFAVLLHVFLLGSSVCFAISQNEEIECNLDSEILDEIHGYQNDVDMIIDHIMEGEYKGKVFNYLQTFVDFYGPRLSGSDALETTIDWIQTVANVDGFDNVYTEDVVVPHWVRNEESATMVAPRIQKLQMLGLGRSVETPAEGITADVIAVRDFDELDAVADKVPGKIVVFYQGYESYGQSVNYRVNGASEAAKYGAVATLIQSAASFSIASPHTGDNNYQDGVPKIPTACISVEDAGLLYRLSNRASVLRVTVELKMDAVNLPDAISRNTFIEAEGTELPEEKVVMSGHIDSWDVGTGAMDDAGGCFIAYHANYLLKSLGLRSRRTITTLWFTGEEQGVYGGSEFFNRHRNESDQFQLLMESDGGTFPPLGIGFTGSDESTCIMREILSLTSAINTTQLQIGADTPDLNLWNVLGVPRASPYLEENNYFWFHHSNGDTIDVVDSDALDTVLAMWASVAYVAADISVKL